MKNPFLLYNLVVRNNSTLWYSDIPRFNKESIQGRYENEILGLIRCPYYIQFKPDIFACMKIGNYHATSAQLWIHLDSLVSFT